MTGPKQVSFDEYLDTIFAGSSWVDGCIGMLSAFLEDIDAGRDDPGKQLPQIAPSIVEQVAGVADRALRLQLNLRSSAERRGPEFQTPELGAVLWWAGMGLHKSAGAIDGVRDKIARNAWEDAFFEIHALLYDVVSAVSLLSVGEGMLRQMEGEQPDSPRPN